MREYIPGYKAHDKNFDTDRVSISGIPFLQTCQLVKALARVTPHILT